MEPKFKVGDQVKESLMSDVWIATIIKVGDVKEGSVDGHFYVTAGKWGKASKQKKPTTRQLYAQHLEGM